MENDLLKQKIITTAKDLPLYFSRIFKFEVIVTESRRFS